VVTVVQHDGQQVQAQSCSSGLGGLRPGTLWSRSGSWSRDCNLQVQQQVRRAHHKHRHKCVIKHVQPSCYLQEKVSTIHYDKNETPLPNLTKMLTI
jgi:hypothetical protein